MEQLPIVNEQDVVVGEAGRDTVHLQGLLHREVYIYLISHNNVLLQKRQDNNKWDHSCAGHVDPGETYLAAAQRELKEELGITLPESAFQEVLHDRRLTKKKMTTNDRFFTLYILRADIPLRSFVLQPEEVVEVKYFSKEELAVLLASDTVKNTARALLKEHIMRCL